MGSEAPTAALGGTTLVVIRRSGEVPTAALSGTILVVIRRSGEDGAHRWPGAGSSSWTPGPSRGTYRRVTTSGPAGASEPRGMHVRIARGGGGNLFIVSCVSNNVH